MCNSHELSKIIELINVQMFANVLTFWAAYTTLLCCDILNLKSEMGKKRQQYI